MDRVPVESESGGRLVSYRNLKSLHETYVSKIIPRKNETSTKVWLPIPLQVYRYPKIPLQK